VQDTALPACSRQVLLSCKGYTASTIDVLSPPPDEKEVTLFKWPRASAMLAALYISGPHVTRGTAGLTTTAFTRLCNAAQDTPNALTFAARTYTHLLKGPVEKEVRACAQYQSGDSVLGARDQRCDLTKVRQNDSKITHMCRRNFT
jgi:hypothetical protein